MVSVFWDTRGVNWTVTEQFDPYLPGFIFRNFQMEGQLEKCAKLKGNYVEKLKKNTKQIVILIFL